jgi:hypothetical protein
MNRADLSNLAVVWKEVGKVAVERVTVPEPLTPKQLITGDVNTPIYSGDCVNTVQGRVSQTASP